MRVRIVLNPSVESSLSPSLSYAMNTEERESEPTKPREGGNHDYELNRLIKSGTLMDALLPLLLAWLTWNNLGRQ